MTFSKSYVDDIFFGIRSDHKKRFASSPYIQAFSLSHRKIMGTTMFADFFFLQLLDRIGERLDHAASPPRNLQDPDWQVLGIFSVCPNLPEFR